MNIRVVQGHPAKIVVLSVIVSLVKDVAISLPERVGKLVASYYITVCLVMANTLPDFSK